MLRCFTIFACLMSLVITAGLSDMPTSFMEYIIVLRVNLFCRSKLHNHTSNEKLCSLVVVATAPSPIVDSPPPPTTMTTPDILDLNTLPARDPMICFRQWFDDVQSCDGVRLPTSASLATANRLARSSNVVIIYHG